MQRAAKAVAAKQMNPESRTRREKACKESDAIDLLSTPVFYSQLHLSPVYNTQRDARTFTYSVSTSGHDGAEIFNVITKSSAHVRSCLTHTPTLYFSVRFAMPL